ncbi:T-cell receptor-associated transmembrane adapter 1-like [Spea bombifrons]|uniref:T-cell receptor-associated transmembrane adapter 1-like n=1 Tax=Spea bombifrons TaxID=233779 RepID=UPI00234BA5AE|nr:T-cell receptor-associated transmembrane adapter 1-like [Spea bombifrons]
MYEDCMQAWVPLVVICCAFTLSLICNIVQCALKHKIGKDVKCHRQRIISCRYEDQYIANNPIYGNLNQPFHERINESCYEEMSNPHKRKREEIMMNTEETMCYAALNLSPKILKKNRKKKAMHIHSLNCGEDKPPLNMGNNLSNSCIYLNSDQLTAESKIEEDLIQDDPLILYGVMQKIRNNTGLRGQRLTDLDVI